MMRKSARWYAALACLGALLSATPRLSRAQEGAPPSEGRGDGGGGGFAGMQRVGGEVTGVSGATVTVKTEDGASYAVVTTDNTRVMKGRGVTVKVADLKAGDYVVAAGNLDAANKSLHAAMLFATDAAQVKAMRENLGKTYIAGRVVSLDLDNARMTVERPDHVKQTIAFDETTSFRRGRGRGGMGAPGFGGGMVAMAPGEATPGAAAGGAPGAAAGESITLADIKVGDVVAGQGIVKSGVFVPAQLMVSTPGAGRGPREGRPGKGAGAPPTPGATAVPVPPPSR